MCQRCGSEEGEERTQEEGEAIHGEMRRGGLGTEGVVSCMEGDWEWSGKGASCRRWSSG